MFSYHESKFLMIIHLAMIFGQNYLISPSEAVSGVVWSKNASDFVRIFSIQSFDKINTQRISIDREFETHNFNGKEFRFSSFAIENLLNFVENDTVVSGVHGDMWQVLSELLNFKIHVIKIDEYQYGTENEKGEWNGLIGYVYRNETDIIPRSVIHPSRLSALQLTLATWKTGYRIYIEKNQQSHKAWMISLFDRELWFSVIGLFFVLTLASYSIHVLNFTEDNPRDSIPNLRDHFFYVYSMFCNQGWTPWQLEKRSKLILISTRLFAWLLVIAFGSKLIARIAQQKFHPPFDDLESFYKDSNYKLIVQPNSFIYSVFQNPPRKRSTAIYRKIFKSGRLITAKPPKAEQMICNGDFAYFEVQDVVDAETTKPCEVIFVGKAYFVTGIVAGLARGFKYTKAIDIGILKLQQYGIMDRIKDKWLTKTTPIIANSNTPVSISLEHVSVILGMLAAAVVLSLLILLIENIVHLVIKHNHRTRYNHRFHNQQK